MLDGSTPTQTWRDNWFVKNWLMAIPVIRGFFKTKPTEIADALIGDSCMVGFGTAAMMLPIFSDHMQENMFVRTTFMTTEMVGGMAFGMALYNTLKSGADWATHAYSPLPTSTPEDEVTHTLSPAP